MKKALLIGTGLAVSNLMSAGIAQASEKISLTLGGFSTWWIVAAQQQDTYQAARDVDFNSVDIKGDNEIYFQGATTLDSGMKVGIRYELEAGGHTDQGEWDKAYAYVESGLGKVIAGAQDNGANLLHVSAPDAAGNTLVKDGVIIDRPANFLRPRGGLETPIDGAAESVTYITPAFGGLSLGASYLPNLDSHDRGVQTASEMFVLGALYAATLSDVEIEMSAGWATYDAGNSNGTVGGAANSNDYSAGLQVGYAGFTLGGSYRAENHSFNRALVGATTTSTEGDAWDVGVQYATGPYAVSLKYFESTTEGHILTAGNDKMSWWQASGKYTLGAGIDLLGSVLHADFDDETALAANNNKGWAVMTGLGLSF